MRNIIIQVPAEGYDCIVSNDGKYGLLVDKQGTIKQMVSMSALCDYVKGQRLSAMIFEGAAPLHSTPMGTVIRPKDFELVGISGVDKPQGSLKYCTKIIGNEKFANINMLQQLVEADKGYYELIKDQDYDLSLAFDYRGVQTGPIWKMVIKIYFGRRAIKLGTNDIHSILPLLSWQSEYSLDTDGRILKIQNKNFCEVDSVSVVELSREEWMAQRRALVMNAM